MPLWLGAYSNIRYWSSLSDFCGGPICEAALAVDVDTPERRCLAYYSSTRLSSWVAPALICSPSNEAAEF